MERTVEVEPRAYRAVVAIAQLTDVDRVGVRGAVRCAKCQRSHGPAQQLPPTEARQRLTIARPKAPCRETVAQSFEHHPRISCLSIIQLLSQVGTGNRAREYWRAIHETYIAADPTDDDVAAYRSLDRLGLHRIERWLAALADEGAVPAGDVERRARFLQAGLFTRPQASARPARARCACGRNLLRGS
ncbi:hypothetical protein ABTW72_02995 [Micromonospora sp. NPDC127501]|uniref:hypothetical protein n=1 Tax=Micromonospora sp. NPDC127501 TaxID=3154872 RepID=UPI003325CAEF